MSFVRPPVRHAVRHVVRSRLWYVLDRQLLNGWSHRHQNRRLCSRPHSNESVIFFEFLGFIFFKLWRVGEFSLRFTAAVSAVDQRSLCLQRKRLILHYAKIGDAGCIRLHVCSTLQRRRRGLWTSLALLVGRGPPTLAGPGWEIGETMNKGSPLTMQNVTWRR